jgi:hypothetical protein
MLYLFFIVTRLQRLGEEGDVLPRRATQKARLHLGWAPLRFARRPIGLLGQQHLYIKSRQFIIFRGNNSAHTQTLRSEPTA